MADRIKFYMDEHVPRAVTAGLRRRGVDVVTAQEAGLHPAEDERHLAFAVEEARVVFPLWSCPIPPKENRLNVRIEAGEKKFHE